MAKRKHIALKKWSEEERQAFADGQRHKASTFADKRKVASKGACRGFRWQG